MFIFTLILVIGLLFLIAWCINYTFECSVSESGILAMCLLIGVLMTICLLWLIRGFVPFFHDGLRPSFKVFLVLWLGCSFLQVTKVAGFEISGNLLVDSLLLGLITAGSATLINSGLWDSIHNGLSSSFLYAWLVVSLGVAIIVAAFAWALK